jgi:hypothetical protein
MSRWRKYTAEEAAFLASNRPGHTEKELLEMFNARFSPPLRLTQVEAYCNNHGLRSGLDRRFGHGQDMYRPPKGTRSSPATEFKKGNRPQTWKPVGTETFRSSPRSHSSYWYVKVAEPNKWKMKHILVWESIHGPRPAGHNVVFADGNRHNFDPLNLVLVSKKQNAIMCKSGLHGGGAESVEVGKLIADVKMKASARARANK